MTIDNAGVWATYASAIAQAAGLPGAPDNLVLTGTAEIANFATGSSALPAVPTKGQALYETYNLANTQAHDKFVYDSDNTQFFNDYATYIDNLVPKGAKAPTPTQTSQMKLAKAALGTAQTTYGEDLTKASDAWAQAEKLFPGQYPTFAAYLAGTSWGATINSDNGAMDAANSKLSTLMTSIYGQSYVAIQNAKTTVDTVRKAMQGSVASGPSEMPVDATSGTLIVPTYNPGDLNVFSSWVDGIIADHTSKPASQQAISVNVTESSAHVDFSTNSYYSHTAWGGGFLFFRTGGSVTHSGSSSVVNTDTSDFDMTIGFDGITTLDLTRGPWFDSSLMYDYQQNGLSVPTKLLIAMYPQLELKMDTTSFAAAQSAYNSSSGFSAGFFFASASHQQSSSSLAMTATFDSSSNSVSIASGDVNPVIVGMEMSPVGN